jgi:hypothetical protein
MGPRLSVTVRGLKTLKITEMKNNPDYLGVIRTSICCMV